MHSRICSICTMCIVLWIKSLYILFCHRQSTFSLNMEILEKNFINKIGRYVPTNNLLAINITLPYFFISNSKYNRTIGRVRVGLSLPEPTYFKHCQYQPPLPYNYWQVVRALEEVDEDLLHRHLRNGHDGMHENWPEKTPVK